MTCIEVPWERDSLYPRAYVPQVQKELSMFRTWKKKKLRTIKNVLIIEENEI